MTDMPTRVISINDAITTTPLGAVGHPDTLAAAYRDNTPVTIDGGQFDGDVVYLGHTSMAYDLDYEGVMPKRAGLHRTWEHPKLGPVALYYIDQARIENAPKVAAALRHIRTEIERRVRATEARAAAENARIDALDQEG